MYNEITPSVLITGIPFQQKEILLLEDDLDDQDIMKDLIKLSYPKYGVTCFGNTDKALDHLSSLEETQLPSLIILDLNMPTVGGLELLKTLKGDNHFASIPVVVYSNSTYPPHKTEAIASGACLCLSKKSKYEAIKEDVGLMLSHCL